MAKQYHKAAISNSTLVLPAFCRVHKGKTIHPQSTTLVYRMALRNSLILKSFSGFGLPTTQNLAIYHARIAFARVVMNRGCSFPSPFRFGNPIWALQFSAARKPDSHFQESLPIGVDS